MRKVSKNRRYERVKEERPQPMVETRPPPSIPTDMWYEILKYGTVPGYGVSRDIDKVARDVETDIVERIKNKYPDVNMVFETDDRYAMRYMLKHPEVFTIPTPIVAAMGWHGAFSGDRDLLLLAARRMGRYDMTRIISTLVRNNDVLSIVMVLPYVEHAISNRVNRNYLTHQEQEAISEYIENGGSVLRLTRYIPTSLIIRILQGPRHRTERVKEAIRDLGRMV